MDHLAWPMEMSILLTVDLTERILNGEKINVEYYLARLLL